MEQISITYLGENGYVAVTETAVMIFDYTMDPTQSLPRILMTHPGLPVTFMVSGPGKSVFPTDIFSMAETRQRTFIVATTVARTAISPDMPVSWLDPDDIMPGVPGDLSVTATRDNSTNVTFTVTLPDDATLTFDGHTGKLTVGSTVITLDRPGQTISQ